MLLESLFFRSSGSGAKYCYDRFPSNFRTDEQEEKRRQILAAASGALEYSAKHRYIHAYISVYMYD